ncbi:MAG: hypothetical protein JWM41_2880 [Gemmatimonadetes bacterium]|nr:hypothetical protein [Gemmatimonadota bacterium]
MTTGEKTRTAQATRAIAAGYNPRRGANPSLGTARDEDPCCEEVDVRPPSGALQEATERVQRLHARVSSISRAAESNADRLTGSRDEPDSESGGAEAVARGQAGDLHMAIEHLERAVEDLAEQTFRFGQL